MQILTCCILICGNGKAAIIRDSPGIQDKKCATPLEYCCCGYGDLKFCLVFFAAQSKYIWLQLFLQCIWTYKAKMFCFAGYK